MTSENGECSASAENPLQPHHRFVGFCKTRPKYRQGKRDTAVKVYTISSESKHILVFNVSNTSDLGPELRSAFEACGAVSEIERLPDYPREKFTDVFRIKFERLTSARLAKRKLDNVDFYGGRLHVCYAPEYETMAETRGKLQFRQRWVAASLRTNDESARRATDGPCVRDNDPMVPSTSAVLTPATSSGTLAPDAVSQARWHRLNSTAPTSEIRTRKRYLDFAPIESTAPKKRTEDVSQPLLDVRTFQPKAKPLRLIPRSVTMKGKSITINTDKDANNKDTITGTGTVSISST